MKSPPTKARIWCLLALRERPKSRNAEHWSDAEPSEEAKTREGASREDSSYWNGACSEAAKALDGNRMEVAVPVVVAATPVVEAGTPVVEAATPVVMLLVSPTAHAFAHGV
eukprot:456103-Prymnesium_polylepis.1